MIPEFAAFVESVTNAKFAHSAIQLICRKMFSVLMGTYALSLTR
jgi:hypothetical protein